jgi:hypothetical protein
VILAEAQLCDRLGWLARVVWERLGQEKGRGLKKASTGFALVLSAVLVTPVCAAEKFDGRWTVETLNLWGGMCTSISIRELKIRNGLIEVSGHGPYIGRIVASGKVDGNGAASIDGYLGAHFLISISGEFNETEAHGRIDFFGRKDDCAGTWKATRASAN